MVDAAAPEALDQVVAELEPGISGWDSLGSGGDDKVDLPPVDRRWQIAYGTDLRALARRTNDLLEAAHARPLARVPIRD
jgi:hypothetical protein